jgi:hypothetical protein
VLQSLTQQESCIDLDTSESSDVACGW